MGKKKRCAKYDGPDIDDCTVGRHGRCRSATKLSKAYTPQRRAATPAQLSALEKARAARKAKAGTKPKKH